MSKHILVELSGRQELHAKTPIVTNCYCNIGKKLDLYASKVAEVSVFVSVPFHKINY